MNGQGNGNGKNGVYGSNGHHDLNGQNGHSHTSRRALIDWISLRVSLEALLRVLADTVLINLAFISSLVLVFLWRLSQANPYTPINYRQEFYNYLDAYGNSAWLLTVICLVVFYLSGFYSYGRFYQGKYKVLIVAQAVSISYLIFGAMTYIAQGVILPFLRPLTNNFPRGALLIAWGLTAILLIAARLWSSVWRDITRKEHVRNGAGKDERVHSVLVIGGAGYIGSALVPRLLDKGYRVRLLDLLLYGTEPIEPYLGHPRLEIIEADFRQIDRVVEAMRDMDAVIHLGGIVGDPACALDEELTIEINVMATRMIAEVAKGSGVRHFIFASTCSVYGASDQMLDERSQLNPVSLYARSKIASERVLLKMADDRFSPVILRFGTIYGLSGRTRFDLVINLLTAKSMVDNEITVFGGEQWRPFLHVDDAAQAMVKVLEAPLDLVRNQIFNVGSNEQNYTINEIAEIIHRHAPSARVVHKGADTDRRNYWVNFSKIHKTLDFKAAWTVDQGVDQVIEAITSGRVTNYRDTKYSNVLFLRNEGKDRLQHRENGWAYQLLNESTSGDTVLVDL
jgi:nucleoside-diphosphate-sugar epimerase